MAEVRWSLKARNDLQRIKDFIAESSEAYASDFATRLVVSVRRLREFPRMGRTVPELGDESIREVLFRGPRVVYSLEADRVTIVHIVHGARDLGGLIRRGEWTLE